MGAKNPLTPRRHRGVTPFAGGRASVVPNPGLGHRLRRAVETNTDRPPEAGGGGRRVGGHSAPRAPRGSGGDNSGSTGKNFFWPESDVGRGTLFTLALTFAVVFATPSDREPSLTRLPESDTRSQRDLR